MMIILSLILVFGKVALGSFGGGLAALTFIEYELCIARDWLTREGFVEIVSLAQMTPGPVALNAATFIGYKLGGFWGSFFASASLICTPILILISLLFLISHSSERVRGLIASFQLALRPAVAGLICAAFWSVLRPILPSYVLWGILALCAALLKFQMCRKYPQLIILFGALAGLACKTWLAASS